MNQWWGLVEQEAPWPARPYKYSEVGDIHKREMIFWYLGRQAFKSIEKIQTPIILLQP